MRILHFADAHISDKNIEELEKCLNFIVETAKEEEPDIVIFAGDLFDAAIRADSLSAKLAFRIFKELADIAPVVAILGTQSHDFTTSSILQYINARFQVHVATHPSQLYLCDGYISTTPQDFTEPVEAVLSLMPAPTKQFFKTDSGIKETDAEIANELSKVFMGFSAQAAAYKDAAHILVGHWQTDGAMVSETQSLVGKDISLSKEQMALGNFNLICLGHLHERQQIGNIFYSGSIMGLTWGETTAKGFYIHEFDGKELINSRFIQTPSTKLIKLAEDLTGVGDLADTAGLPLMDILLSKKSFNDVQDAKIKVELKVFQDEASKVNTEELKEAFMSKGAKGVDIQLVRMPRENVRSQKILQLETLRDKLIEMAALNNSVVPGSILAKADLLEAEEADKIIQEVAS